MELRALAVLAIALATTATTAAAAEERTPEQVVQAFFGPSGIADRDGWYAGEMLRYRKNDPTLGQRLPPDVAISLRELTGTDARSVYCVALSRDGTTQDWYAYLVHDEGGWKLESVRTLALTGVPASALQELRRKSSRSRDEEWRLRNLELLFRSDAELKRFVAANAAVLEEIAKAALAGKMDAATKQARSLYLDTVHTTGDGRIEMVIGGVLDNSAGIMYVPDGHSPPAVDPSGYIYVERVTDRLFVFKST